MLDTCPMVISCMAALLGRYPYLLPTIEYHLLTLHYDIHTVYIGDKPYDHDIWPEYPAAFSHRAMRRPPGSITHLLRFIRESPKRKATIGSMFSNSWSMLESGVAFLNADYILESHSESCDMLGINSVVRMDQMSHFISGYVLQRARAGCPRVTLVGIGKYGRMVAREVKARLVMRRADVKVLGMSQPVSAMRMGWTDAQISMGEQSIFDTVGTERQVLISSLGYDELLRATTLGEITKVYRNKLEGCTVFATIMSDAMRKSLTSLRSKKDAWSRATGGAKATSLNTLIDEMCASITLIGEVSMKAGRSSVSYDAVVTTATSNVRKVGTTNRPIARNTVTRTKPTLSESRATAALNTNESTDEEILVESRKPAASSSPIARKKEAVVSPKVEDDEVASMTTSPSPVQTETPVPATTSAAVRFEESIAGGSEDVDESSSTSSGDSDDDEEEEDKVSVTSYQSSTVAKKSMVKDVEATIDSEQFDYVEELAPTTYTLAQDLPSIDVPEVAATPVKGTHVLDTPMRTPQSSGKKGRRNPKHLSASGGSGKKGTKVVNARSGVL